MGPLALVPVAGLLLILPLTGIMMTCRPISDYLEFPPITIYVEHSGFSWTVFCLLSLLVVFSVGPFLSKIISSVDTKTFRGPLFLHPFPIWGWAALLSCLASWLLAWTRFEWFSMFQPYTFFAIWLSFIILVNAMTSARSGRCMMKNDTRYFLLLFLSSAFFWWFFEYLNRFVQNWHYVGSEIFTGFGYIVFASICFSTVLPAVLGVCEFLETFCGIAAPLDNYVKVKFLNTKHAGWTILTIACTSLALIGIYPDYFFPILWLSPFLIITSVQTIKGEDNIFSGIREGRWSRLFLLAISVLVCGFLWEMWNFYSLPKWVYSVPFVGRFKIFEMPLLGYAGYILFGIECGVAGDILRRQITALLKRITDNKVKL